MRRSNVILGVVIACMVSMSAPLYAKEVTSAEVLSDLSYYIGKTVTLSGLFIYSEPMRESFTVDQNSKSIEIFYRDLSKNEKDVILAQKNFSRASITVTGVVQPYANRTNAFFLNATSLPAVSSASDTSVRAASIYYSDIVSDPLKYVGQKATLKGLFMYSEPMRESFTFDQNGHLIEVFYRDLANKDKDLILSQKKNAKVPVIVTGTIQQFTNKTNAYFMNASSVVVGQ
jgi:hypothetical protein